ncbi:adenosine deaminase [Microbacterium sp. AG157]|uniref:adenosine deaminase n=1 Tax=Microbacterium testaceum TaxID=2033 RepID=A0A4Y3QI46_MICTE|nr:MULTISPECIES: adenosine deaminase [Microbacterium]REC99586.1 adenosine deaminase [Microbacterium sp. AG157]WJS91702.1 adenosine deaminase [Microbacterium testaceum]GEB44353.1 adenosine deaminase 1 [Microbacterium testaceum]
MASGKKDTVASEDFRIGRTKIAELPKVSLHDHLDGGLRPQTVLELADEIGLDLPADDAKGLEAWFSDHIDGGSLEDYLEKFSVTVGVMQTREGLVRAAKEFVEDLAADGVVYGEVRWAPEQHLTRGLSLDDVVDAVQEGIEQGEDAADARGRDIRVGQLLTALRHNDNARDIAELAVSWRGRGVVGFDLAGPEDGFLPQRHREAFDYLAEQFFPTTVHAGEGAGLASIRSALLDGRALRLGHGVRIANDLDVVSREGEEVQVTFGDLARWVRDREITLELSPTSNLQSGAVTAWGDTMDAHPFDLLYQLDFSVTVNVDNRLMSATTLTRELGLLAQAFEYDLDDLEAFQLNAAAGAFLPVEEREELIEIISEGFHR